MCIRDSFYYCSWGSVWYFSCFGVVVDTSWRKCTPSQIPLAQSTHFGITFSPTSSKFWRGRHVHIFFTGPRIGASDENVSPPTTGHQKGQNRSGVSIGKPFFPMFVWTGRLQVLQGMSIRKSFHANIRKSDLPMVNLEWNITQKLHPTLKPSTYKQLPKIRMFSAETSICPRRFTRDGPELLHTCSTCMSIPRPYLRVVLFTFAEYIWSNVVRTYTCVLRTTKYIRRK